MAEIVLVRHAESDANVEGLWQGRGNSALSPEGRRQVEALTRRVDPGSFDAVYSSPLNRAAITAQAFGRPSISDELAEIDLGEWEGRTFDSVAARDVDLLRGIYEGSDEPFGKTGERLSQVGKRAWRVVDAAAEEVGGGGRAVIVTHGGVIDSLMAHLLPTVTRRPHRMAANTSLSHLRGEPERWRMTRFNDTTHLGRHSKYVRTHIEAGGAVLALIRHGRTLANAEGRVQGQSCWGLDDHGRDQVKRLVDWYGDDFDNVYTSPLDRAVDTARYLSDHPVTVDGLKEIGCGEWEGLLWEEVTSRYGHDIRRIFGEGEDIPRGRTGESWSQLKQRISATVGELEATAGSVTGIVSHGGAITAYVESFGGGDPSIGSLENTSVTHVALTSEGPVLCDFGIAPHLEGTDE